MLRFAELSAFVLGGGRGIGASQSRRPWAVSFGSLDAEAGPSGTGQWCPEHGR